MNLYRGFTADSLRHGRLQVGFPRGWPERTPVCAREGRHMGCIWVTVSTVSLKKKTESTVMGIQSFSLNFCSNPNYKIQLLTT